MSRVLLTIFVGFTVGFVMLIPLTAEWKMAQGQNTSLPENTNSTRMVLNLKDKTVTLINATTNETISVRNLAENTGNMTTNQSLTTDNGNMTTNQSLTTDNGNMTTNQSLTEKFKELGK
jgi:hypothetical protein